MERDIQKEIAQHRTKNRKKQREDIDTYYVLITERDATKELVSVCVCVFVCDVHKSDMCLAKHLAPFHPARHGCVSACVCTRPH